MIEIVNPIRANLIGYEDKKDRLSSFLTYRSKSAEFEYRSMLNNKWFANRYSQEEYYAKLSSLKEAVKKCLLFDDEGQLWTYSGLAEDISRVFHDEVINKVVYPEPKLFGWYKEPPYKKYGYQEKSQEALLKVKHGAVEIGCHRKGEKVLKSDGSVIAVENVIVGDLLMGPDSLPREVKELKRGVDSMYKIETTNGQTMYVNGHHILALRRTNKGTTTPKNKAKRKDYKGTNPIVFLTVEEYLDTKPGFKHLHKLFSTPINLPFQQIPIDPYFLGLLLGDGCFSGSISITTIDNEIASEVRAQAAKWHLDIKERGKESTLAKSYYMISFSKTKGSNQLINEIRKLGLMWTGCPDKRIPDIYKQNSINVRLEVLAGLLDTDGSLHNNCFDYISKSQTLAEDVCFLARSVGLRATIKNCKKTCQTGASGKYWRVGISGDTSIVPIRVSRKKATKRIQKKDPTSFGFTVTKVSDEEDYYGFILDQDHLYLMENFLVTHNTGLGKSYIILHLIKELGLPSLIMSPMTNISEQLYKDFVEYFGLKNVGRYYGGKKEAQKKIVIANAASLTKLELGSEDYKTFQDKQVFISDESHTTPAQTFSKVCFGPVANAPYRFFFSGTQMRNDGADMLLKGIVGPVVYSKTVKEGINEKYLARPIFRIVECRSESAYESDDAMKMTRKHLYYNRNVNRIAADIANKSVLALGHQVIILVEEIEQFSYLLPLLKITPHFAHGGVTKDNKGKIPKEFHDSNPKKLVDLFNDGKIQLLVGTSCVSTGTNFKPVKTMIYLQGGKSEIQVRQSIGRVTRLCDNKTACNVFDFDVTNINILHKHAIEREDIYNDIYGPAERICHHVSK